MKRSYYTLGIGMVLVFRITPSPGNFIDYAHPGITHTLRADEIPAGGDYCGDSETQKKKVEKYRDIQIQIAP